MAAVFLIKPFLATELQHAIPRLFIGDLPHMNDDRSIDSAR